MVDERGFVRLHRKVTESAVFKDPELFRLFCYLLCRANWRETSLADGTVLRPGQLICGRDQLARELGGSPSTTRRRMKKLEMLKICELKTGRRGTVVTLCNWGAYQNVTPVSEQFRGQQVDNRRTAGGHSEESNNQKNSKKDPSIPDGF